MSDDDHGVHVPIREFIEMVVRGETGMILTRLTEMDKAHAIQAGELARRLDELNHAHDKAVEDRQDFVKREVWETQRRFTTVLSIVSSLLVGLVVALFVKLWH